MFQASVSGYATLKMELLLLTKFHKTLASTADDLKLDIERYLGDILACLNIVALHH